MNPRPMGEKPGEGISGRDTLTLFGLKLTRTGSLKEAFEATRELLTSDSRSPRLVTFANPLSIHIARTDPVYRSNLARMDLVFSDGIALTLAARRVGAFRMQRVSFDSTSLAPPVWEFVRSHGMTVALVGGKPGVAGLAAQRIRTEYPGISILGSIDGFRPRDALVEYVRVLNPSVLICGMGAPHQEAFLTALADAGWTGTGFTCGGYLDQLGIRFHFYPALIDRCNLRWLYRLVCEPRRLGYRYTVEYGAFWRLLGGELIETARLKTWRQRSL
jgi:N-acetylglucosaminyldiphosphoundecaprenol N-acetyl-beta-D-mannosaminyltransferase